MPHSLEWIYQSSQSIDLNALQLAQARQQQLTKPMGSLGVLEQLAIQFAGWSGAERPELETILIRVFAGDHGVCQHGVSAFPQEVTAQMVRNFVHGGAAISALARDLQADFCVINMGTVVPIQDADTLINLNIAKGSADLSREPAMSETVLSACLNAGRAQVNNRNAHLFIAGDMGIGNTTSAAAIYSALLGLTPKETVGPGTGVDEAGIAIKQAVIAKALKLHQPQLHNPVAVLRCLGGLEIAGMVGAYISAAQRGIPILVDGFISTAAALLASKINSSTQDWMIFAHQSAEPAHVKALDHLNARPLLNLDMRLGEGSGAAVAVPIIKAALSLHNNMATFTDAGVTDAN